MKTEKPYTTRIMSSSQSIPVSIESDHNFLPRFVDTVKFCRFPGQLFSDVFSEKNVLEKKDQRKVSRFQNSNMMYIQTQDKGQNLKRSECRWIQFINKEVWKIIKMLSQLFVGLHKNKLKSSLSTQPQTADASVEEVGSSSVIAYVSNSAAREH